MCRWSTAATDCVLKEFVLNEQWAAVAAVENDLSVLGEQLGRLVGYLTATDGTFSPY
jgi:hypothetical protein